MQTSLYVDVLVDFPKLDPEMGNGKADFEPCGD
jgi:hypothetical protein